MFKLRLPLTLLLLPVAVSLLASVAPGAPTGGRRSVEGWLINRTDPAIVAAGTELEVLALSSGMAIVYTAATDAAGRFHIVGLPDNVPLMLRAVYKGVNYHGALDFDAGGKAHLELEVYEPTTSLRDIVAESVSMVFQLEGDHLHAVENWEIVNQTNPPRVYVNPEGTFRLSKAAGLLEPPLIKITAPGTEMPLTQSALESADSASYYSLYPLRPGRTTIEARQTLPYVNQRYVYEKKFFQASPRLRIGVIPRDMTLTGATLEKLEDHPEENFTVYAGKPIDAGAVATWTFTGGTPLSGSSQAGADAATVEIIAYDGIIGRQALVIGPSILLLFVLALWYACNRLPDGPRPPR